MSTAIEDVVKLSVAARLELIEILWNSILDEQQEGAAVTAAEREELLRRLQAHEADPQAAVPWEIVRARLGVPERP